MLPRTTGSAGYRKPAPPRKPAGRDKVSPRPVKVRLTLTEMSCGGGKGMVQLYYKFLI